MLILAILITFLAPVLWLGLNYFEIKQQYDEQKKEWVKIVSKLIERHKLVIDASEILSKISKVESSQLNQIKKLAQTEPSANAAEIADTVKQENELGNVLGQIFQTAENDPAILDNPEYVQIRSSLLECEDTISTLRTDYNKSVLSINYRRSKFPTKMLVEKMQLAAVEEIQLEHAFEQHKLKFKPTHVLKKESIFFAGNTAKSQDKV